MGKGDRKRKRLALPTLAPAPRKPKRGRARMDEMSQTSQRESLEVRAKRMGMDGSAESLNMVKAPWFTDEAGTALFVASPKDVSSLWRVVEEWRKCENRFLMHVIGRRMYPGRDSIPHIPEPMETRDDVDYDLRSEDEKVDAAKRAFAAFCDHTAILTDAQRKICQRGIWDSNPTFTTREPNRQPELTRDGKAFVVAIKRVHDAIRA